jgi:hypothetical protein
MICELKISVCIPPLQNMRPPPIYPQLSHLHDHGLAILASITPFRNMCLPPISILNQSTPFHLKRSYSRSDFSPLISSKPQVLKRRSIEKKRKRGRKCIEKKKAPRVSSNKRGGQYFERRKTLQLQKFFFI